MPILIYRNGTPCTHQNPLFELHISRHARDFYGFDDFLYGLSGHIIFADFNAVRTFAHKINDRRDTLRYPEKAARSGDIHAMGLIDEINHFIVSRYRENYSQLMALALEWLDQRMGEERVDRVLQLFLDEFPPLAVYRREMDAETYWKGDSDGTPHRHMLLEELMMLWLSNRNPAFSPYTDLIDESPIRRHSEYKRLVSLLHAFFQHQPAFGPDYQNLIDMLREPARVSPNSFPGQLEFILEKWGHLLGQYLSRLLLGLDLAEEENRIRFGGVGQGHGPVHPPSYVGLEDEAEAFSQDLDWMPKVVVMAKNIYVWLHQLSRQYGREILRLDEIPDEELDRLADQGMTGLWFIGLWQRSAASKRIKNLCGNPDAEASAYSLFDYEVAADLGGWDAFHQLKSRAWKRGIRMAGDMVPNHVGIDGRWVIHHPDWFIGLDHPPYPSYQFDGPDLSPDDRVGVYLENHYYDRSDAAVVFKRVDHHTGAERYIYHGNDGTSMPWNDTAQLDFLNPDTREAVIQTILHVARNFPIIRLDAAMTLVKKHIRRLWYPEPGSGGAIPSRAGYGLSLDEFNAALPKEFWRQVVDRVAAEAPDTLLLAEAFWMLEGYFVRTLGMHRVYNSAFMNMLKTEDNAGYRKVMKDTLEFNPEILKRFVNFMNNPDEETAVAQFGRDDKYFGVCMMMATLPGLPMFGHGQIEGFTEKYGMEYRRPRLEEVPDAGLVERHHREIFPLLKKRALFSGVDDFLLYDFYAASGSVNENVFAYSNRREGESALAVYHNKFARTDGWIRQSAAYSVDDGQGGRRLVQKSLGEGLGLHDDDRWFTVFRDHVTGLTYLRNSAELCRYGLFVSLEAFKYHIFLDFREVEDRDGHYRQLAAALSGRGVPDLDAVARELMYKSMHEPLRQLLAEPLIRSLCLDSATGGFSESIEAHIHAFVDAVARHTGFDQEKAGLKEQLKARLRALQQLSENKLFHRKGWIKEGRRLSRVVSRPHLCAALMGWILLGELGRLKSDDTIQSQSVAWMDEFYFTHLFQHWLQEAGLDSDASFRAVQGMRILSLAPFDETDLIKRLLKEDTVRWYLGVNRYHDVLWFHKESFDEWADVMAVARILRSDDTAAVHDLIQLKDIASRAEYRWEALLDTL